MTTPAPAAIALFLYRRPEHARRVVDALRANALAAESDLYVFCDGPKSEEESPLVGRVHELARTIDGFRSVTAHTSPRNKGLARSIIDGVNDVFAAHARAVIVEDDIVLSPMALMYFNAMLERFDADRRVASIAGFAYPAHVLPIPRDYVYDVFFTPRIKCWGWATWRDRWRTVDWNASDADAILSDPRQARAFAAGGDDLPALMRMQRDGQVDSWAIRWDYHQFRSGTVCLHPCRSYVTCIGFDGSGTHGNAGHPSVGEAALSIADQWTLSPDVALEPRINRAYKSVYDRVSPRTPRRLLSADYWRRLVERRLGTL